MLKPDPNDPNYKEQMKQYEKDPSSWGPGGAAPIVVPKAEASEPEKPAEKPKK